MPHFNDLDILAMCNHTSTNWVNINRYIILLQTKLASICVCICVSHWSMWISIISHHCQAEFFLPSAGMSSHVASVNLEKNTVLVWMTFIHRATLKPLGWYCRISHCEWRTGHVQSGCQRRRLCFRLLHIESISSLAISSIYPMIRKCKH